MIEFPLKPKRPLATETAADLALGEGDHWSAEQALFEGIRQSYAHDPEKYHHLALKAIALPFYELAANGATPERLEEAASVHGWAGDLLDSELEGVRNRYDSPRPYKQRIGRISELVVFGLLARAFDGANGVVPMPATQADDTAPGVGTDFYLVPLQAADDYARLQVKTRVKEGDRLRYARSNVRLVGLDEIDPHYSTPLHDNSLAQRILQELAGQGDDVTTEALDAATDKLFGLIAEQAPYRSAS